MKTVISLMVVFMLICPAVVLAQQKVEGKITNSDKRPLEGVTLILKDSSGHILAFGRSGQHGHFTMETFRPARYYRLELTSIGYKKKADNVEAGKPLLIVLETEALLLKDVVVKNHPVLRKQGDTLDYNPADFANKDDRSIGDVIRKMPGLTMNEAGKIEYNGKAISRLYLDKDNLLDDKYNLATKAIPHDAVEKLQVIENDQPVKMLRKYNMSEDVALNVVLKNEARLRLMGDVKLGGGLPEKYEGNANAMLLRKNNKFMNNAQINNMGTDPAIDLTSHNLEALLTQSENIKPAYFLSTGEAETPLLPSNRTLFNRGGLISLNNLLKWDETYQMRFNAAYYGDRRTTGYVRSSAIYLPGDTVHFSEEQFNLVRPQKLQTRIELMGNAEKYYLKNALSFDVNAGNANSALKTQEKSMDQHLKQQTLDFSNQFNFQKMFGAKYTISANSLLARTSLTELLNVGAGINEDLYNTGEPYEGLFQNIALPAWFAHHTLSFSSVNKIKQTYQVSHVFQHQELSSRLMKVISKDPVPVEGNTANGLDWKYSNIGLRALYEYKTDKITSSLTLPVSLRHYKWLNTGFPALNENGFLNFEPAFHVKIHTGPESYVSGSYAHSTGTGTIQDVYTGAILRDYRSLVLNEAPLSRRQTDRVTAAYQLKKALKMFFLNVGSSYATVSSNTISSYLIEDRQEKRTAVFLENRINLFSVFTTASKYLFDLTSRVNAGANFSVNRFEQLQNGQLRPFTARSLALNAGIHTKINANINAEYEVKYNTSRSFSGGKAVREPYHQFRHQLALHVNTLKDIRFGLSGQYLHTQQPHQKPLNYLFADASIVYALKKAKTDFVFNITNLVNVRKFDAIYLAANSYTSGTYYIPGRMAVLSARFFFN